MQREGGRKRKRQRERARELELSKRGTEMCGLHTEEPLGGEEAPPLPRPVIGRGRGLLGEPEGQACLG